MDHVLVRLVKKDDDPGIVIGLISETNGDIIFSYTHPEKIDPIGFSEIGRLTLYEYPYAIMRDINSYRSLKDMVDNQSPSIIRLSFVPSGLETRKSEELVLGFADFAQNYEREAVYTGYARRPEYLG